MPAGRGAALKCSGIPSGSTLGGREWWAHGLDARDGRWRQGCCSVGNGLRQQMNYLDNLQFTIYCRPSE
jgi:hypothetical protein